MKRIVKFKYRILVLLIEICTLILIFFLSYNFVVIPKGKKTFYIPSSTIASLKSTLLSNGYDIFILDKLLLPFIKIPQKGWYTIKERQGRFFFFTSLYTKQSPLSDLMNIKIFAGETNTELTKRLANDMDLNVSLLLDTYQKYSIYKEADILSDTYTLPKYADENTTLSYLFDTSNRALENFKQHYAKKDLSQSEINILLIIASIIQKESNTLNEMPMISSVIYNRLKKNMRLQMDGTLNYGPYSHTIVTPERIKTDASLYNTYKHKGLPPMPLCTIKIKTLEAAYSPKSSKYLFFMLTSDGSHTFAETYAKHLINIRTFRETMKEKNTTKEPNIIQSINPIKELKIVLKKQPLKKSKKEKKKKVKESNLTTEKNITVEHVLVH